MRKKGSSNCQSSARPRARWLRRSDKNAFSFSGSAPASEFFVGISVSGSGSSRSWTREEVLAAWSEFAPLAGLRLPTAPEQPVEFDASVDRPQPRLDKMRGHGMASTVAVPVRAIAGAAQLRLPGGGSGHGKFGRFRTGPTARGREALAGGEHLPGRDPADRAGGPSAGRPPIGDGAGRYGLLPGAAQVRIVQCVQMVQE